MHGDERHERRHQRGEGGGILAASKDGVQWQIARPAKAYSRTIRWQDGTTAQQGHLERPQLLIQNGRPTHIFFATGDGRGGFANMTKTWNMVIPLGQQPDVRCKT